MRELNTYEPKIVSTSNLNLITQNVVSANAIEIRKGEILKFNSTDSKVEIHTEGLEIFAIAMSDVSATDTNRNVLVAIHGEFIIQDLKRGEDSTEQIQTALTQAVKNAARKNNIYFVESVSTTGVVGD